MRSMPPDGERDTGTSSVPGAADALLRPSDAELIADWGASLRARGYAASTIQASSKRLETFARRLPDGLLKASKQDVVCFFDYGEASMRRKREEQRLLGLKSAEMRYFNHPTWANFVVSAKQFYAWAEGRGLIGRAENPLNSIREYRRASI